MLFQVSNTVLSPHLSIFCMGDQKSTTQQISISDYLVYAIYRLFESFLRLLPMEVVCVIGSVMGQASYFLMSERRKVVIRNLRIVYGHSRSPQEIRALARKTFRFSGLNLISSISASTLSTEELLDRVEVEGRDHLINALNQDSGCILLLAHMGNWELLTQLHILVPEIEALASLYRPLNNPLLDRLIKRRRQRSGTQLFSKRDGFAKPINHLKTKGTLGVIADQNAGRHGLPVQLFGKLSSLTYLPALLHRKTKAPIIPVSMCTLSPGKWKVILHPAVEISEHDVKDTYQVALHCTSAYERVMRESPADVLWMHNYWRRGKRTPLKALGLTAGNMDRVNLHASKYFYLLIHVDSTIQDDQLIDTLTYLRACRPDLHITLSGPHDQYPNTDYCLKTDIHEPPHLAANALRNLEGSMPAPFDTALDLSDDGSGVALFKQANISHIFSLTAPPKSKKNNPAINAPNHFEKRLEQFIIQVSPSLLIK